MPWNPKILWTTKNSMEPSGLEPLTPCMPCSFLFALDLFWCNAFRVLSHLITRQTMRQVCVR